MLALPNSLPLFQWCSEAEVVVELRSYQGCTSRWEIDKINSKNNNKLLIFLCWNSKSFACVFVSCVLGFLGCF